MTKLQDNIGEILQLPIFNIQEIKPKTREERAIELLKQVKTIRDEEKKGYCRNRESMIVFDDELDALLDEVEAKQILEGENGTD